MPKNSSNSIVLMLLTTALNTCVVQYFLGDTNLSRASRARKQTQREYEEMTPAKMIRFNNAVKAPRRVELIPKSQNQEALILALLDETKHIVVTHGPAGTGKTYIAMQAAIKMLKEGQVDRIILTRPAVGVDDEKHGFLPGDLNNKMEPWTRPLFDILREYYSTKEISNMLAEQTVEISPLAFCRGRTFKRAVVVVDEAQNTSPNQMLMILTRIGTGSKIVVTGDVEQTDRTVKNNGLLDLVTKLETQGYPGLTSVKMTKKDIQRHPIIDTVLEMYAK